jgi:hypothetical protein
VAVAVAVFMDQAVAAQEYLDKAEQVVVVEAEQAGQTVLLAQTTQVVGAAAVRLQHTLDSMAGLAL